MKRSLTYSSLLVAFVIACLPLAASAQTDPNAVPATDPNAANSGSGSGASVSSPYDFQREGIFGCSYNGAYSMSVGAFAANGGAYVPVADATVELNSGILVYQQCVLREVIDRMRESVTSALVKQNIATLLTGRGGAAMFVQQPTQELTNTEAQAVLRFLQNNGFASVDPTYQSLILSAAATGYRNALQPNAQLGCSITNNDPLLKIATPGCTPINTYWIAQERMNAIAASAGNDLAVQWNWGRGDYPQQSVDANGNPYTTAPSALVDALAQQTVQSGFNQLQNANDIGQMIGALFAGLGTQILSSNQGLLGLTQPNAGQPSYLDQLAAESSAGLRNTAVNAAITQLAAAQQVEQQYFQLLSSIAKTLTQTIGQIRGYESQCWVLIQQKVCTSAPVNGKCTDQGGTQLMVATSTVYSQAVITAQIAPIATTTAANLYASQSALNMINQLIAGVTNTTSLDAQRIALQQLDTLIASHQLHTQNDVSTLQNQQQSIQAAMQTLSQNVPTTWGDGTPNLSNPYDPNSGWCNVNNASVVQMWDQLWQKH